MFHKIKAQVKRHPNMNLKEVDEGGRCTIVDTYNWDTWLLFTK